MRVFFTADRPTLWTFGPGRPSLVFSSRTKYARATCRVGGRPSQRTHARRSRGRAQGWVGGGAAGWFSAIGARSRAQAAQGD